MATGEGAPALTVRALSARATRGLLSVGALRLPCALGRGGRRAVKREGDGATPIGRFAILRVLYRRDRLLRPRTALPLRAIRPTEGWCDAPLDRNYNRPVPYPYPASAEALSREDGLYDLVAVLDYNLRPRKRGAGSAIFMHVARDGFEPTAGCVALRRGDLIKVLALLRRGSAVLVPLR